MKKQLSLLLNGLLACSFCHAWTLQDLLEKKTEDLQLRPFEGGNFMEQGFQQISFVFEQEESRKGSQYLLRLNPRNAKEQMAIQELSQVSKQLTQQKNSIWSQQEQLQLLLLCIEISYTKRIETLAQRTIDVLEAQKKAQSKSLMSSESGNIKDYIKASIAIKNFRKKVIEIHEKRAELNERIRQINPEWSLDNFVSNENVLNRQKVVEHVKGHDQSHNKLYAQLYDLELKELELVKKMTIAQNNRLVDAISLGVDQTRNDTALSFRIALNLPYVSSNPLQDWQFENKLVEAKRQSLVGKRDQQARAQSLREKIIRLAQDLDLDITSNYDKQIEKTLKRLKYSEPLSTIALYADYLVAKISGIESERDFFMSYADWLNESQDFQSSYLFNSKGLL